MAKTNIKVVARSKRVKRIRKKISGTSERPRLQVFKSARHIYAQIIDDSAGHTLTAASSLNKEITAPTEGGKKAMAKEVGILIARMAKEKGIETVVFDRSGNLYHGRVKSLSDGAREGGLVF